MRWRLVAGVPEEDVRRLISVARRRTFGRGEVVFHREDPADSLHLVQKGRFAVRIMTPLGETVTIAVRGPGDSFGEMALVDESARRSATVAALEDAETLAVYQAEFQRLRKEHPQVDRVLIGVSRRRRCGVITTSCSRHSTSQSSGGCCAASSSSPRLLAGDGEIPLTQEQLAELAGTSRATVNRVLRDEQERGTVELRRGKTIVVQPDELARRARLERAKLD